ncbi:hypothetical protein FN846DRAFT_886779 [Sphaerosporella brunnea]|uniref:Rap-GAP domain-containing protein n=1 Tax=Sphaerosporella brunnea TaxID=1250544 RepID=A0A5J5F7M7_9PEZI|nr:hypothetical protein FN846DRAFT_886779 [Sphaerosporella brunnea]
MTPNPTPVDPAPSEPSRAQSGIANVFRNLGLRNRSGFSIQSSPATPSSSSNPNRSTSQFEYFAEGSDNGGQDELLERLRRERPIQDRVLAAEILRSNVGDFPSQVVAEIWHIAQDLVRDEYPAEARQAGFKLLTACLRALNEPSALDRLRYYRTIAQHDNMEDFDDQLQAMIVLTSGGRNLSSFEREIGGLLSKWLRVLFSEAGRARQIRKREGGSSETVSGAEFCLKELFKFVTDIIKFNFGTFEEREITKLLSDVLSISRKTTNKKDIECSITFIETLITYGYIPPDALRPCIEILCGTYSTIRDLADDTWNAVSNLCKSHMAHKCILTLLDITRKPHRKSAPPNTNTLRGALWFLEKLLLENGENGLPKVQFSIVMTAFRDALSRDSPRLDMTICAAMGRILARPDILLQISFDEWAIPLEVLVHVSRRTTERADGVSLQRLGVKNVPKIRPQDKEVNTAISQTLFQIINQLEEACRQPDFLQTEGAVEFFLQVYGHIPDSTAEFVLNYYSSEHLCYPSCAEWLENSQRLVDIFFRTRKRPSELRVQVLSLIKDVYWTIREVCEESLLHKLVLVALEDFRTETDPRVLEALVRMIVDVAADSNMEMFDQLVTILVDYLRLDEPTAISPSGGGGATEADRMPPPRPPGISGVQGSLANIVLLGLVKMFIRNMNMNALKGVRLYEEIVKIAGNTECSEDARLTAMKLLFRLRADSEHRIFLTDNTESDYLAGVLNRTVTTLDDSEASTHLRDDDTASSRSNRSSSVTQSALFRTSTRTASERHEKGKRRISLWGYPESRPLPETPARESSPVLQTFYEPREDFPAREGPTLNPKTAIRVSRWIEQVIPIIQQGCDWEIYSYVLCHLPSQLANKTMFRNCKAHITLLRTCVCDQLHTNRLPDTDLPSDVKRADIAVSLLHMLTVLVSYREHFAKTETEGIVKAFQLGLHSWNRTAKPCIHALALCCYELPGSTSKFLSGILTKLSQIITSPVVSVHILEFLSALAKLPSLYSNFTEPDFRNIFGIAFRYIQHAKETASQRSTSHARAASRDAPQENSSTEQSDLPQYVLTLAYNVLTTWFLSLRLSERPKYVSWIIRGLVLHDQSNHLDEQSEACIDMLQRFTYSKRDLKPPGKLTSPGIVTKNWVNGMTILTIQMHPESGVSRIIIRRPAGTSYYSLRPDAPNARSALLQHIDIDSNVEEEADDPFEVTKLLPSHLLLQFAGGTAMTDQRPILLPDDEKVQRHINVFDRTPTVDFHKIGVIYVGAGQTEEREILSNTMGSPDFTDFVDGLGELVRLKGTDLNTGGLDHEEDFDGEFAYFWRDRTTEIVFHVTTMMPTREEDPLCTYKKRHIGNDFVNIIFNNSGLPWRFGTIPSQFNFVSIVISPEARSSFVSSRLLTRGPDDKVFYRVQVCCRDGFTDISPAQEPKMVSAKSLPSFVRNIALNASVYSHVFNEGGGEHISNPRHRLRSIKQLRERMGVPASVPRATSPIRQQTTTASSRRVSAMSSTTTSTDYSLASSATRVNGATANSAEQDETEDLLMSLDFSRYT